MRINSPTIAGSILLFIVTTVFISFVLSKLNPKYLQKQDKSVNLVKSIGMSSVISAVFTSFIMYISINVDKQNLKRSKKSSPL